MSGTEFEIEKLTQNLPAIRKIAGWSSEDLGKLIGVSKQTISNIETRKSKMTKTQYIAIRTIIDLEIAEHPENELLVQVVELLLNGDNTPEDIQKAEATRKMVNTSTKAAIAGGALAGVAGVIAALAGPVASVALAPALLESVTWLKKLKDGDKK